MEVELVRWNALAERWYHSRNEFIHPVPTSSTHGGAVAAAADRTAPLRNYAETLYSEAALLPDLSAFLLRLSARLRSASAVAAQLTISGVRVPGFLVCLAHLPQLRADSCAVRALVACVVPFFTPPAATDARAARLRRRAQSWASETLKSFFRTGADIEASLVAIHDSADSGMVEQQQQQQRRRLREALPVERMLAQVGKLTGTSYDDEGVLAGLQAAEGATVLAEVLRLLDEQAPSATAPVAAATTPDSEALAAAVRLVSSLLVALLPTPPGREEVPGAAVGAAPLVGTVADGTCAEEQGREARWALILPVAERLLLLRSPPPGAETAGNCEWLCSTFVDAMQCLRGHGCGFLRLLFGSGSWQHGCLSCGAGRFCKQMACCDCFQTTHIIPISGSSSRRTHAMILFYISVLAVCWARSCASPVTALPCGCSGGYTSGWHPRP